MKITLWIAGVVVVAFVGCFAVYQWARPLPLFSASLSCEIARADQDSAAAKRLYQAASARDDSLNQAMLDLISIQIAANDLASKMTEDDFHIVGVESSSPKSHELSQVARNFSEEYNNLRAHAADAGILSLPEMEGDGYTNRGFLRIMNRAQDLARVLPSYQKKIEKAHDDSGSALQVAAKLNYEAAAKRYKLQKIMVDFEYGNSREAVNKSWDTEIEPECGGASLKTTLAKFIWAHSPTSK